MRGKRFIFFMAILLFAMLAIYGCLGDKGIINGDGEKIRITIGKVPYSDMWMAAHIIDNIASELGYPTEIIEADIGLMYQGLAQGAIMVFPDVCLPHVHQAYIDKYEGKFDIIGKYLKEVPSGLTVPAYMDIRSIEELKNLEEIFQGRLLGVEFSAGIMMLAEATLMEYELDGYTLLDGSTSDMLKEVKKAVANREPILFLSWRPHPMWVEYDLKILADSKGIWENYDVRTGINNNLKEEAPDLYNFIREFTMTLEEVEELLVRMEEENMDPDSLAKEWINENRQWIDVLS
ncbi:MAG: glycine betaine ABC transporter substrate-binding protein [Anaerovoracaceae bacterium]